MLLVLVVFGILLASWIFFKKPTIGLILVFISLPFERIGSLNIASGMNIKPVQLIGVALIVAYLLRVALMQDKVRSLAISRWIWALAIWALVPVALINYLPLWQDYFSTLFVLLLCWIIAQLINPIRFELLAKAVMIAAIVVGCFGIYQLLGDALGLSTAATGLRQGYTSLQFGFPRIHGPASEPLFYASYLLLPLFVSLGYLLTTKSKKSLSLAAIAFALTTVNLMLTTSKGGIVAGIIGSLLLLIFLHSKRFIRPKRLGMLMSITAIVVTVGFAGLGFASSRIHHTFSKGFEIFFDVSFDANNASYQERLDSTRIGLDLVKKNPITGIGVGGVGYRLEGYQNIPNQRVALNNYYLEVLVELGLIGLLLFLGLVLTALVGIFKTALAAKPSLAALIVNCLIVALLLQLISYSGFFITYIWVVLGLAGGLAASNGLFNRGKG